VGGSSAGTAAAITAARLGIPTIWVLRAPRDIGGLSTNGVNPDSDLPMRQLGGLALDYDVVARFTTGFGRHGSNNGEGYFAPFHVFFAETRRQVEALPSLTVLAGLYPMAVAKDPADTAAATMAWNGSVTLDATHRRWSMEHFLSNVEGWRMPDGRHVLESLDVRDREANEKAHLARVVRGLWHLQHVKKEYRYGLSARDFREGLPAKYTLAAFGTATNAGDAPLPGLIYMREGRRLVNDHVFGGRLIEDDGSGRFVQKRHWHLRAAYFKAMLVDIHGVHRERVPGSGPEAMQLLRLAGVHDFGAPCIPFDVFVPRPAEATGFLVASAGAYTHQAYAAFPRMETGRLLQGHACAVAVHHALADGVLPHAVDVRKVQLTGLELHGQPSACLTWT